VQKKIVASTAMVLKESLKKRIFPRQVALDISQRIIRAKKR
jgi:hypothetical protein